MRVKRLNIPAAARAYEAECGGKALAFEAEDGSVTLNDAGIGSGETLRLMLR